MNILKFTGNWLVATVFALFALAILAAGGLKLLGWLFDTRSSVAKAPVYSGELVLTGEPRA
jgi:hypothetical protein